MQKFTLTTYFFITYVITLTGMLFFIPMTLGFSAISLFLLMLGIGILLRDFNKLIEKPSPDKPLIGNERELFEGGPMVIFRWQAKNGWPVEYVSPNIKTIFGFEPIDFYSGKLPFANVIHPDDLPKVFKEVMDYSADGNITTFEQVYRLKNAHDEYRWVSDFTRIIRNNLNEITHYHGYIVDINEYYLAQEALTEEQRRLSTLVEALPDAIFLKDGDGRWQVVNSSGLKLFGLQSQPWQNKTDSELGEMFPEAKEIYQGCKDGDELAWQTKKIINVEEVVPTENGSFLYFDVIKVPLFDANEERQSLVIIGRDITQRKYAEAEMTRLFHQNELLLNAVSDGILGVDREGNTIFVNPSVTSLTGWNQTVLLQSKSHFLLHHTQVNGESYPVESCPIYKTYRDGQLRHITNEVFWRSDGSCFPVEYTVNPIFEEGKLTGAVVVFRDITERRKAELELRKAVEAADAANRAKSDFLANMSHEIRTPMNAIIGMTSLMLDFSLNDTQQDYLNTIRASSETLLIIINDILDLSKIESGKLELENQPFLLRNCIEEALDLVMPFAAKKMLNLSYVMQSSTPETVIGDITRLRQILVNLLTNAVKFTEQGEIKLLVDAIKIEHDYYIEQEDYNLRFEVKDTGIGISQEGINRLFRSFSQVDASTTRKYGGTGLGLMISKKLVEIMGGQISVKSVVNKGTTFSFNVHLLKDLSDKLSFSHNLQSIQPLLKGKRILLKDTHPSNFSILKQYLTIWGMQCSEYSDLSKDGDVILIESTSIDQSSLSSNYTPLILLSFSCNHKITTDFTYCLTKPIKPLKLLQLLHSIFESKDKSVQITPDISTITQPLKYLVKSNIRILLAEDNPVNQKVASLMLERAGYKIAHFANNGVETLQYLQHNPIDLIFMDIQMPEMDGLTTTQRIVETYPLETRPYIIAMTANAMEGDRESCLKVGMQDYISKPINKEELAIVLNRAQIKINSKHSTI